MKTFKYLTAVALLGSANAATDEYKWSYLSNGADWPYIAASQCGESNQSPIDLRRMDHSNPFEVYDGSEFKGRYKDFTAAEINNLGKTIQVNLPESEYDNNCFMSEWATE